MTSALTMQSAAEELAKCRKDASRGKGSARICDLGEFILEQDGLKLLKEDTWSFLEQLALAALECGKLDLARVCIDRLDKKFPGSPRVKPLQGMLLEAKGHYDVARIFYERELAKDENNIPLRKRLISLHLYHSQTPSQTSLQGASTERLSLQRGVELLVEHLDTVYTDAEGWQELAETYSSLGLYQQALSALGDLILLQPQNPFFLLRYAETAYTIGDLELAYRYYLRVIELSGKNGIQKGGVARRAALGLKLCIPKLQGTGLPGSIAPSPNSVSATPSPQRLDEVDLIITEALLDSYSSEANQVANEKDAQAVKGWLSSFTQEIVR